MRIMAKVGRVGVNGKVECRFFDMVSRVISGDGGVDEGSTYDSEGYVMRCGVGEDECDRTRRKVGSGGRPDGSDFQDGLGTMTDVMKKDLDLRKDLMKSDFIGTAMGLEHSATRVPESIGRSEHMTEPSFFNNELIANLEAKNKYMQLAKDAHDQVKKAKQDAEGDEDDWMLRIETEHFDSVRREYESTFETCGETLKDTF